MLDQQLPSSLGLTQRKRRLSAGEWLATQDFVRAQRELAWNEGSQSRATLRGHRLHETVRPHGEQAGSGVRRRRQRARRGRVGLENDLLRIGCLYNQQLEIGFAALREQALGQVGQEFALDVLAVERDHRPANGAEGRLSQLFTAFRTTEARSRLRTRRPPAKQIRAGRFPHRRKESWIAIDRQISEAGRPPEAGLSGTLFQAGSHLGEIRGPLLDWRDVSRFVDAAQLGGIAGGFDQVHVPDQFWVRRATASFLLKLC